MTSASALDSKDRIVAAAGEVIRSSGLAAMTFDAVAARLGVTKQAVLYWFPTKTALFEAVALPALRAEADVAAAAAKAARNPRAAAGSVVLALIRFHLADIDRFRLIYVAPQSGARRFKAEERPALEETVNQITGAMYAAIEAALGGGARAREAALALHMAALGHVLLVAVTEAMEDPLRHSPQRLAERLADLVTDGIGVG